MTDNIKLPPMPVSASFYGMYGEYTQNQLRAYAREAVRLNSQANAKPRDLSVMELAESVGLIGPASRADNLHEAIQRFYDLIVDKASAQQPLTAARIMDIHWSKPMDEFQFARAIEQAHGIGVKND